MCGFRVYGLLSRKKDLKDQVEQAKDAEEDALDDIKDQIKDGVNDVKKAWDNAEDSIEKAENKAGEIKKKSSSRIIYKIEIFLFISCV